MKLEHLKTVQEAGDNIKRVSAIAWSPNHLRMAVAAVTPDSRSVLLYDEHGVLKDKFPTKPADPKVSKVYSIVAMAFSPDSTKIAVAQTDSIVYVFKLGAKWGEKKSICNKFAQTVPVTSLVWPSTHLSELFFGLADGKVKLGILRKNKSSVIYDGGDYVTALAASPDGSRCVAGHADGAVYVFSVSGTGAVKKQKIVQHPCTPNVVSWGENVVVAGSDRRIMFYAPSRQESSHWELQQTFDYSTEESEREYWVGDMSPSAQSLVVGSYNRFRTFGWSPKRNQWEEAGVYDMKNMYNISSIGWKKDGSRMTLGSLHGCAEMFDACLRRYKYKGKFEVSYISPSKVIVKRISTGAKILLSSVQQLEVTKVNVYSDRYIVGFTKDTLLCGDLLSKHKYVSEIDWQFTGDEKFFFNAPGVALIVQAGEISVIEYGQHEPIGNIRSEHVSPFLISVRVDVLKSEFPDDDIDDDTEEQKEADAEPAMRSKKLAYLLDQQTINIQDLVTDLSVATVQHDARVDWLELNDTSSKLLFRDSRRSLHLFDVANGQRKTMLNLCSYVQWVPKTDVVVAQARQDLCVWYNIEAHDQISQFPVKGDVVDIERADGKTDVVVDEGTQTTYVSLNEPLIAFGVTMKKAKYGKACDILEEISGEAAEAEETLGMWSTLASAALKSRQLHIAERAFAALGDVSKAKYVRKLQKIAAYAEHELSLTPGTDYYVVQAKLMALDHEFIQAEQAFTEQGQAEDAMEMYQQLHKWEDAIRVAEQAHHPAVAELKVNYYQWLMATKQEERAAVLKEKEGDYGEAVSLFLKAGLAAKAAALVLQHDMAAGGDNDLLQRIADQLFATNLFEKAGHFFELLNDNDRALDSYKRGHAYASAVKLCRKVWPDDVVGLELEWGEWLVAIGQNDQAINHFIEAAEYEKAIKAATDSRQWTKAVTIVDNLPEATAKVYFKQIARHYDETLNYELAEKYYIQAGHPEEAVAMYSKKNMWEQAHAVAKQCMSDADIEELYVTQAEKLARQGKHKEAEKMYITIQRQDEAITMYKYAGKFDDMIRLVTTYHKDLLQPTHEHLGQQLEAQRRFTVAEKHYVAGLVWRRALEMYRTADMWEDALRVAKQHGGPEAMHEVLLDWARSVGGDAGVNMLLKFGQVDAAIDYALDLENFKRAEEICKAQNKAKLPHVYEAHARLHERAKSYPNAETEYIKAGSVGKAIEMYAKLGDWDNAMRVAESYDPGLVTKVYEAQARVALTEQDFDKAEMFFVKAQKPEEAVAMYKELNRWNDVVRVSKEHGTDKIANVTANMSSEMTAVQVLIQNGEYDRAIDSLLERKPEELKSGKSDLEELEESWEKAVQLVTQHVPSRVGEVYVDVAQRLCRVNRFQPAAELLEGIEKFNEAIDCYVIGELWDQASALAAAKAPQFVDAIADTRCQKLAERQDWEGALQVARGHSEALLGKYQALYANERLQDNDYLGAARIFAKWGAAPINENFPMYKHLVKTLLGRTHAEEEAEEEANANKIHVPGEDSSVLRVLRTVFFRLLSAIKEAEDLAGQVDAIEEFERVLFVVHLAAQVEMCKHNDLPVQAAKAATSLLKFAAGGWLPTDKAYALAGNAWRELSNDSDLMTHADAANAAYMILNRFVDIIDQVDDMEDDDVDELENDGFEETDIPFRVPLPNPERLYLSKDGAEDVRDWVLAASLKNDVMPALPEDECDNCHQEVFSGAVSCPNCKNNADSCIITGYPVKRAQLVQCTSCAKAANREDWNAFVGKTKMCPHCQNPQRPS